MTKGLGKNGQWKKGGQDTRVRLSTMREFRLKGLGRLPNGRIAGEGRMMQGK